MSRALVRIAVLSTVLTSLVACGGGSSPTVAPTPTPAPTPLPPVIVAQTTGYSLPAGYIAWLSFPTSRAGTLDGTVDWTAAANDIDVYLVAGECNYDQLNAGQCRVVASAETSAKPEKFTYASAQASTYTIFVGNSGPGDESMSLQVVLSATLSAGSLARPASTDAATAGPAAATGEMRFARR